MANFRENIDALEEAGLADSEILEIMSESVDGQMHAKNLLKNKESGHELPKKNSDTNAEIPSVCKRKVGALSAEKHPKSTRQGFPTQSLERERKSVLIIPSTELSLLSPFGPDRFSFSADMDEAPELAEKALNGEFPELPKKSPRWCPKILKNLLKVLK